MAGYLLVMLSAALLKGAWTAGGVEVTLKESVVKEGDPIEFLCHVKSPVIYCRIGIPSHGNIILTENSNLPGKSYFGNGLAKGDCGVRIKEAKEKYNGMFLCAMTVREGEPEVTATANLTIARSPSKPELKMNHPERGNEFKEGDMLSATCIVREGRPVANITWYIGEDRITEGLGLPVQLDFKPQDLYSIEQNLTRKVQASDNGKELKCIASHPLLNQMQNTTAKIINVIYPPKESNQPLEKFGLVEGEEGKILVTVAANPKPMFTWIVGEERLNEGQQDPSGRFTALHGAPTPQDGMQGSWDSVLVINPLRSEDVEKNYELIAKNALGQNVYKVVISTSPEPKMIELGAGAIIGIVVAVLVLLTIAAVVLFARAKGRWCFGGGAGKSEKDGHDPEKQQPDGNDNPAANHNAQFISDSPDLKKVKEDTPV